MNNLINKTKPHFEVFSSFFALFAVLIASSCQLNTSESGAVLNTSTKSDISLQNKVELTSKSEDGRKRWEFANRLNESAMKNGGEGRTSTRGNDDEELITKSSKITNDECYVFIIGGLGKLATSLGFKKIVCINQDGVEYSESLSNFKKSSVFRQKFTLALNRLMLKDKIRSRFKVSTDGKNNDQLIINNTELPKADCIKFSESEYGTVVSLIGFVRIVCKGELGSNYSLYL